MKHNLDEYVGRPFKLKSSTQMIKFGEREFEVTNHELDDPALEAEMIEKCGGKLEIVPPGVMVTAEHNMFRTRVYIGEDGIIESISNG